VGGQAKNFLKKNSVSHKKVSGGGGEGGGGGEKICMIGLPLLVGVKKVFLGGGSCPPPKYS